MDLIQHIKDDFKEKVSLTECDPELKKAVLRHERVNIMASNIASQLKRVKNLSRNTIKMVVYDFTEMYINTVKRLAEERIMSECEKLRIIQKDQERKEKEAIADQINKTGVYDGEGL